MNRLESAGNLGKSTIPATFHDLGGVIDDFKFEMRENDEVNVAA